MSHVDRTFDARGMRCPIPVLRANKELRAMNDGEILEIQATDGQAPRDFRDFCAENGHLLLTSETHDDGTYRIVIQKKGA